MNPATLTTQVKGAPAARGRRWARVINPAIGVLGAAVLVFGLLFVGRGAPSCRGVEMRPGDVCTKSTFTQVNSDTIQTYEQRRASAQASRPTVVGLGAALVGFSALLMVMDRRRGHGLTA